MRRDDWITALIDVALLLIAVAVFVGAAWLYAVAPAPLMPIGE